MSAPLPTHLPIHSPKLGALLTSTVPLTDLDIEEVLAEQRSTSKPFGQLALELGLCTPEHVWRAWADQLADGERTVDLDQVGIDAQALYAIPPDLALEFAVLPIRYLPAPTPLRHDKPAILVLATTPDALPHARAHLPARLPNSPPLSLRFALADPADLAHTLELCYLPDPSSLPH